MSNAHFVSLFLQLLNDRNFYTQVPIYWYIESVFSTNKLFYFCGHHISPNIPGIKEVASKHLHKTRLGKKDLNYVKLAAKASCYLSNILCNVDLIPYPYKSATRNQNMGRIYIHDT